MAEQQEQMPQGMTKEFKAELVKTLHQVIPMVIDTKTLTKDSETYTDNAIKPIQTDIDTVKGEMEAAKLELKNLSENAVTTTDLKALEAKMSNNYDKIQSSLNLMRLSLGDQVVDKREVRDMILETLDQDLRDQIACQTTSTAKDVDEVLENITEISKTVSEKICTLEDNQVEKDKQIQTLVKGFAAMETTKPRSSPTKQRTRTRTSSEPPLKPQKYTDVHRRFMKKEISKCRRTGVLREPQRHFQV